jgi:hypothetical protein
MTLQERHADADTLAKDGNQAWLIVAAAFLAGFVVFGIIYCFGVFLEPMVADLQAGRGAVSALFSITGIAFYMFGPLGRHAHMCRRWRPSAVGLWSGGTRPWVSPPPAQDAAC